MKLVRGNFYKKSYTVPLLYVGPFFVFYSNRYIKGKVCAKHWNLYSPGFEFIKKASKEDILLYTSRCKNEYLRAKLKKVIKG